MGVNVGVICAVFLCATQAMGVRGDAPWKHFSDKIFNKKQALPIETTFKLPSATPVWPPGGGFANGIIDLGGLQVSQISTFNKVWATYQGGPDNQGATVFEPTGIPNGFFMLGSYSQPNNKPRFGWVLVAKDVTSRSTNTTLKKPVGYTLIWSSSASLNIKQDKVAYVWLPTAPDGYKAVGHVVTSTPDKPSLDKIRCVRLDLTDQCEISSWIWGSGSVFNFYVVRPSNRGTQALGVNVGTFGTQIGGTTTPPSIACLKNINKAYSKSMPNVQQIEAIVKAYSPTLYMHPDEEFLPSSVDWFFSNGALLYKKGEESKPVPIAPHGTNLPQGGNNDGSYWLDLPVDQANKERVKKGNLPSSKAYVHVKPMVGGTFTDIAMWVFYPFNGPARATLKYITINLGKIGEHVGDWEHVTLRVSNFNGQLWMVYFSQHGKGQWVEASQLEFQSGNKPVVYSTLHGHAAFPHMEGNHGIGVRNDTAKSDKVMDMGAFELVSAEYLGSKFVEPSWLNYFREWGRRVEYNVDDELKELEKMLPGKLKRDLEKIVSSLPSEMLREEGPSGPKGKNNWNGDEA